MLLQYSARITENIRNTVAAGDLTYMGMPRVVTPNNPRNFSGTDFIAFDIGDWHPVSETDIRTSCLKIVAKSLIA